MTAIKNLVAYDLQSVTHGNTGKASTVFERLVAKELHTVGNPSGGEIGAIVESSIPDF